MAHADDEQGAGTSAAEAGDSSHAPSDAGLEHGANHATEHAHEDAGEPLGPVDVVAWAYAAAGAAVGVLTALALYAASTA